MPELMEIQGGDIPHRAAAGVQEDSNPTPGSGNETKATTSEGGAPEFDSFASHLGAEAGVVPEAVLHAYQPPLVLGAEAAECLSATNKVELGRNESGEWRPVPISRLSGETHLNWVWEGFVADGLITDMYGLWKAGKTTLIAALLVKMAEGGELAGRPVRKGRVLVVTEEPGATWKRRAADMGIQDNVEIISRPFKMRASPSEWEKFTGYLQGISHGYDLIVFDALPNLWPVNQENEAGEVLRALAPLQGCSKKAAILLIRHPRKGDGAEATAGRGSGAVSGFVDIIVEFRRYRSDEKSDTRRVLSVFSREQTFECVVEWDGKTGYRCIGEKAEASQEDRVVVVLNILTEHPGSTTEEVLANWPPGPIPKPGRATVQEDLDKALELESVARTGEGVKGSPFRWSAK
jgi:hypothetical protein